jgi:hypothetical protein
MTLDFGRDIQQRASVLTSGQQGLYAPSAATPGVVCVITLLRESAILPNFILRPCILFGPLKMRLSLILRGVSLRVAASMLKWLTYQPSAYSQGYISVWPSVVRPLETLFCSCMPQDASGAY